MDIVDCGQGRIVLILTNPAHLTFSASKTSFGTTIPNKFWFCYFIFNPNFPFRPTVPFSPQVNFTPEVTLELEQGTRKIVR